MRILTLTAALTLFALALPAASAGDVIDRILARTTQARDKAEAAKDSAREIRDRVRDGAQVLTGKVRRLIDEQVDQIRDFVEVREAFVSSDRCEELRSELIDILLQIEYIGGVVQDLTQYCNDPDARPFVDFQNEISLIERLPCGLMLPLAGIELPACLAQQLQDATEALQILQMLLDEADRFEDAAPDPENPLAAFDAEVSGCDLWLEHHGAARRAQAAIEKLTLKLRLTSKVMDAVGEVEVEANVGVHGYAIATLSDNPVKKWAGYIDAVNSVLGGVASTIDNKVSRCVDQSVQDQVLRNQEIIIRQQQLLLQGQ